MANCQLLQFAAVYPREVHPEVEYHFDIYAFPEESDGATSEGNASSDELRSQLARRHDKKTKCILRDAFCEIAAEAVIEVEYSRHSDDFHPRRIALDRSDSTRRGRIRFSVTKQFDTDVVRGNLRFFCGVRIIADISINCKIVRATATTPESANVRESITHVELCDLELCFISHSYRDSESYDQLVKELPSNIQTFRFPKIDVLPDQLVSTYLISAIRMCDAVLYASSPRSQESFWVAFETDYALRIGKPVLSFDPASGKFEHVERNLLPLTFFPISARKDMTVVDRVIEVLKERCFTSTLTYLRLGENWSKELKNAIEESSVRIVFVTSNLIDSKSTFEEILLSNDYDPDLTLFAFLEKSLVLPEWFWNAVNAGDLPAVKPVQMFGDDELSFTNRIDDLIVRCYWIVQRKSGSLNLE